MLESMARWSEAQKYLRNADKAKTLAIVLRNLAHDPPASGGGCD